MSMLRVGWAFYLLRIDWLLLFQVTQNQVWFFEPVNVSTYASPARPPSLDTIGRYTHVTARLRVLFIGTVCVAIILILLHQAYSRY